MSLVLCFLMKNGPFKKILISAYDITEFLRTAYRPFAYCVPYNPPDYCVPKGGGVSPSHILLYLVCTEYKCHMTAMCVIKLSKNELNRQLIYFLFEGRYKLNTHNVYKLY